MSRYLLVEFDDNDSANRMRAQIDNAEANGKSFRVVGMFSKPGVLCNCEIKSDRSVRGAKLGWWVCPECHRPKSGSPQTLSNMLDEGNTPAKYKELFLVVRWFLKNNRVITARSVPEKDWK